MGESRSPQKKTEPMVANVVSFIVAKHFTLLLPVGIKARTRAGLLGKNWSLVRLMDAGPTGVSLSAQAFGRGKATVTAHANKVTANTTVSILISHPPWM